MSYIFKKMCCLLDYIKVLPQYCLPKHGLSSLVYKLTRIRLKAWKNFLINTFVKIYKVDMKQAIWPNADDYSSFNAFFTRELQPKARYWMIDQQNILSPVDGAIYQIGEINLSYIFQAKDKQFSLEALLANDVDMVKQFIDGHFATLYLSPRDYHRIHMPVTGRLIKSTYVPGDLFAVNNPTTRTIDGLFARNERFISIFETELGLMAQIMVGALFVGSMETVFAGQITPTKHREITTKNYEDDEKSISLKQGDEFGHFNMGSTVILLFEKDKMKWLEEMKAGGAIQVGKVIGKAKQI